MPQFVEIDRYISRTSGVTGPVYIVEFTNDEGKTQHYYFRTLTAARAFVDEYVLYA